MVASFVHQHEACHGSQIHHASGRNQLSRYLTVGIKKDLKTKNKPALRRIAPWHL